MLQCFMSSDKGLCSWRPGRTQNIFKTFRSSLSSLPKFWIMFLLVEFWIIFVLNLQTQMWHVSVGRAAGTLDPQLELGTSIWRRESPSDCGRNYATIFSPTFSSFFCTLKCLHWNALDSRIAFQLLNHIFVTFHFPIEGRIYWHNCWTCWHSLDPQTRSKGSMSADHLHFLFHFMQIIVYRCRLPSRPRHSLLLSDLGALLPGQGSSDVSQQFSIKMNF